MFALATRRGRARTFAPLLRVGAVVSALVVAACQPIGADKFSGPSFGQKIEPGKPVPVALLVPSGTGNADLEWLARSLTNSARMAAADAQGAQIDLRIYQAGSSTETAVARANEAADAGAKIILGPLFAESANAVGVAMKPRNINVLSFSNNADIAGGNVFVLGNTFSNVADRLVSYGVKQGKRRYLLVSENDVAGQIGAAAIKGALARNGGTLSAQVEHPVSQSGIEGVTPQIAAAAKSGNVDAVFMTANNQAVLPYLTQKLAAAGVTSQVTQLMGLTRWDEPSSRLKLPQLEGGWFAIPDTTLTSQFNARYASAHGETPHALGSLAYDGVAAIAALARTGNPDALTTPALVRSGGFSGVNGTFRLRPDGSNQRALSVATLRGGQVVVLDPAPRQFSRFGS